ncbi:MAG: DUF3098 domain-containing protein [Bacteroidota bacterium]
MSKRRNKKDKKDKKPITNTPTRDNTRVATPKVAATKVRQQRPTNKPTRALTFGPETYKWMGIGFALVILGLLLMAGARGDQFNEFDESYIYGFRRITLAPIVMLVGLGTVVFAVLKK